MNMRKPLAGPSTSGGEEAQRSKAPKATYIGEWAIVLCQIDSDGPTVVYEAGEIIDRPSRNEWVIRSAFDEVTHVRTHGPDDNDLTEYSIGPVIHTPSWAAFEEVLEEEHAKERRYWENVRPLIKAR